MRSEGRVQPAESLHSSLPPHPLKTLFWVVAKDNATHSTSPLVSFLCQASRTLEPRNSFHRPHPNPFSKHDPLQSLRSVPHAQPYCFGPGLTVVSHLDFYADAHQLPPVPSHNPQSPKGQAKNSRLPLTIVFLKVGLPLYTARSCFPHAALRDPCTFVPAVGAARSAFLSPLQHPPFKFKAGMTSSEKLSLWSLTVPASGFVCGLPATHTLLLHTRVHSNGAHPTRHTIIHSCHLSLYDRSSWGAGTLAAPLCD